MTGKELADTLFKAFDQDGKAGDDAVLVEEMAGAIAGLSPEEMWRFVFAAGSTARGRSDTTFQTFNAAMVKREEFAAALKAMYAAPRPAELPQIRGDAEK